MFAVSLNNPTTVEAYEAIVAVWNAAWPDDRESAVELQHRDAQWPDNRLFQRFAVHHAHRLIAEGSIYESRWAYVPGKFGYGYSSLPDYDSVVMDDASIHDVIYSFVLDYLTGHDPISLGTWTREDKVPFVDWLKANDFKLTMRSPESALDVPAFDFSRFDGVREQVAESGIDILPLSALQEQDPNWARSLFDLKIDIQADVPSHDPVTPEPFEQFMKGMSSPNFLPEGWFIAIDKNEATDDGVGPYIGLSSLGASQGDSDRLYTWLTGVRRTYRRRGIALAAKLHAIEYAQRRGITTIKTDNEENNPMYQINLKLGFEPSPAWVDYERKLRD